MKAKLEIGIKLRELKKEAITMGHIMGEWIMTIVVASKDVDGSSQLVSLTADVQNCPDCTG